MKTSGKAYRVRLLDLVDVLRLILGGEPVTLDTIANRIRSRPVSQRQAERILRDMRETARRFGCLLTQVLSEASEQQYVVYVDRPNKLLQAVEDELDRIYGALT